MDRQKVSVFKQKHISVHGPLTRVCCFFDINVIVSLPSNSAAPTPTIIMEIGSEAACKENNNELQINPSQLANQAKECQPD